MTDKNLLIDILAVDKEFEKKKEEFKTMQEQFRLLFHSVVDKMILFPYFQSYKRKAGFFSSEEYRAYKTEVAATLELYPYKEIDIYKNELGCITYGDAHKIKVSYSASISVIATLILESYYIAFHNAHTKDNIPPRDTLNHRAWDSKIFSKTILKNDTGSDYSSRGYYF